MNAFVPNATFFLTLEHLRNEWFKAATTDMRFFVSSKFSRSLVHKKNFSFQVRISISSRKVG